MYCPKCKYTTFDHLPACPKCAQDWRQIREALNLTWLESSGFHWLPQETAPAAENPLIPEISDPVHESEDFALQEQDEEFSFSPEPVQAAEPPQAAPETPPVGLTANQADIASRQTPPGDTARIVQENQESQELEPELPIVPDMDIGMHDDGTVEQEPLPDGVEFEATLPEQPLEELFPAVDPEAIFDQHAVDFPDDTEDQPSPSLVDPELSAWEIELPEDILPHEYFPGPTEDSPQPGSAVSSKNVDQDLPEADISYDFSDLDSLAPESEDLSENALPEKALPRKALPEKALKGEDSGGPDEEHAPRKAPTLTGSAGKDET